MSFSYIINKTLDVVRISNLVLPFFLSLYIAVIGGSGTDCLTLVREMSRRLERSCDLRLEEKTLVSALRTKDI